VESYSQKTSDDLSELAESPLMEQTKSSLMETMQNLSQQNLQQSQNSSEQSLYNIQMMMQELMQMQQQFQQETVAEMTEKFQALMQGLYTISLVVQNTEGALSSPVSCDVNSVPDDDLRIKMVWNNPNADVDLHLIAPNGNYADPVTDCYFYNCAPQYSGDRPDWGEADVDKDDPGLDIDNITGMGPETAFVNKPANGVYKVIVHSYDLESGPTTVVVKVYGHAIQIATQQKLMTRTNLCWDVYDITVADDSNGDGKKEISVVPLTDEPYDCDPPPLSSH